MPGSRVALGRYEVTVCEYRAFASATGGATACTCSPVACVTCVVRAASLVGEPSDCPAASFSPRSRCVRFMPAIVDYQGNGNPVVVGPVRVFHAGGRFHTTPRS